MPRTIALILAAFLTISCASEPGVSGLGFFNRRNVFVGDNVKISLPVDSKRATSWRLSQFDSAILRPNVRSGTLENGSIHFDFTAATPGEADITFIKVENGRSTDESRTYRVIVRNNL